MRRRGSKRSKSQLVNAENEAPRSAARYAIPASSFGEVRVGPVMAIPVVLRQFQVQPARVFDAAAVDRDIFQHAESRIPLKKLGRLLEFCAHTTGCKHFGLLVGMRFELRDFGALGYLLRHSATVGDAVNDLLRHLHLHDNAAAPFLLAQSPANVLLGYSIFHNSTQGIPQIYDAAIAIGYRILKELCGPSWKPKRVQFFHRPPRDTKPYRRLFDTPVKFGAEVSGVVFPAADLERHIAGANVVLHDILAKALEEADKREFESFRERAEAVLHPMLLGGDYSVEDVARVLGLHQRTLRRRLAEQGMTFRQLLGQVRCEIAEQLLENSDLSVAQIAEALHYDDPTAFTRAFKTWAGVSPSQWRAQS
jgi:AraC-like DNA-binding protein